MTLPAYHQLLNLAREVAILEKTVALLSWDQETYMPSSAAGFRADQLAYFSGKIHRLITASEVGDWLKGCEDAAFPADSDEATNVRWWRHTYARQTSVPTEFVERLELAKAHARDAWVEARARSDFSHFQPHLETLLELSRQLADFWGWQGHRYNALLETYEPGLTAAELKRVFGNLRPQLKEIYNEFRARNPTVPRLDGHFPEAGQKAFNADVASAIGYDFQSGRVDTTTHPFCTTLGAKDVRITTRYDLSNFAVSLYGVLHETGHALYEAGLPLEKFGTPAGQDLSMGIHESQSRLWENHVGRSATFWHHWRDTAVRYLPDLARYSAEEITAAMQAVRPSFIRVEADELTYDLHVMLRFELELALLGGDLEVAGLPEAWNRLFADSFGLKVPDDAHGCLQDIHWSFAGFGYFPTYSLGNLNASQLIAAAERDLPEFNNNLAVGNYTPLLGWLRANVHSQGRRLLPQELMVQATGEGTNPRFHLDYLRRKYLGNRAKPDLALTP